MNYYLAGSVTWDFMFQWCSRYRINCRCSLGISQCKALNELNELSMNSQWTMPISTVIVHWASLNELDELSMNSMSSRWTLNEQCPYQLSLFTGRLSMQNSQWTLNGQCPYKSLNWQLSRDKGLYCLAMEIVYWTTFIVSTLDNGQWTSFIWDGRVTKKSNENVVICQISLNNPPLKAVWYFSG